MPASSAGRLVALALPPGEAFAAALDGAWERGDAVLPLDPRSSRAVADATAAAMQVGDPVEPDAAVVIATSGSTGGPKGVVLTHAALQASARATMRRLGDDATDHWLSCLPWHHIGGLQVLLRARQFGRPVTVHESFDVGRVAGERRATLVSLVPTQLQRLLDAGADLSRFRAILLGGAAADPALVRRATAAGANVVTTYGMSETCGGCVYDGVPLDGLQVRTDRDGRIELRGPMLMAGYRARPDLTAAAVDAGGWLRTGDVGTWDGRRLVVEGRADDVIVTGGENVPGAAVAEILRAHPGVHEVAVVGARDAEWGHCVVAVVVGAAEPPTTEALRAWVRDRAPAAWAPRRVVVVDRLPMLASGKVDRVALHRLAAGDR